MVLQDCRNVSSSVTGPLSASEKRVAIKGVLLLQRGQLLPTQCTIRILKSDYETNIQDMQCFQRKDETWKESRTVRLEVSYSHGLPAARSSAELWGIEVLDEYI